MSPEGAEILRDWVHDAMYEISSAHYRTETWHSQKHQDGDATNAAHILEHIRRIEIMADEAGYDLDAVQDIDPVRVADEGAEDGKRPLTQRQTIDLVKAAATSAMEEAALVAELRAVKARIASVRAKRKSVSVQSPTAHARTGPVSVQTETPHVRTSGRTT